ncbi:MAG TPA: hypothetical protein PLE19_21685 [Planctomycetota bacterium]|nr:hypothetical protein [Planctomycetota bacterium]HRR82142.1 hypothetical protein [Planctomycetota bacterium]HRT94709.1 hypothetical protein [Planctomycetota bacterium]
MRLCSWVLTWLVVATVAAAAEPAVLLPLDRAAYVVGEKVPLAVQGAEGEVKIELAGEGGPPLLVYQGKPSALVMGTEGLAAGTYAFHVNGRPTGVEVTLASPIRKSPGAITDESMPSPPQLPPEVARNPARKAAALADWRKSVPQTFRETGIDVAFSMCASEMDREPLLDEFTAASAMLYANPYTRPMSFNPARVYPLELASFRQRLALSAQANSRYPSFAGFCLDFDPVGLLARKMLLVYWGWGQQEEGLRNYIARSDQAVYDEFTRRTGLKAPRLDEYITYLLAIGRPEFAPAIDLPTARWIEEMAQHLKPLEPAKLAELEKRIDAWAAYLMGIYEESDRGHIAALRPIVPSMHHTGTINIDHAAVRDGQYVPWAYRPFDIRYITAWNDQVAGPDYAYQWLFSAAMLNTNRGMASPVGGASVPRVSSRDRDVPPTTPSRPQFIPIWVGTSLGMVHGQAEYPGKFVRAIAHNLAHGASGAGFALEGFSTVLGGMNKQTHWSEMKGKAVAEDLHAGRDFLNRFAFLATECRGDYGVGILYSRSQMARQHVCQGFGTAYYKLLVSLTRLGYTPRFITEEEVEAVLVGGASVPRVSSRDGDVPPTIGVKALVVAGQTVPLPPKVVSGIEAFAKGGGLVLVDGSSTVKLAGAKPLGITLPFVESARPYNWSSPNTPEGLRHIALAEEWHREIAPAAINALGDTGSAWLRPERGADSRVTVTQVDGGRDAKYLLCVNDSSIKTHTDWFEVSEKLLPSSQTAGCVIYDLTEERVRGSWPRAGEKVIVRLEPDLRCDLSATTARVFALLRREASKIAVRAGQSVRAGDGLAVQISFLDKEGSALAAALPFHLALLRPDRSVAMERYRSTTREGSFGMAYPIPLNAPPGEWKVAVRSQLTGDVAELPVTVKPPRRLRSLAQTLDDRVLFRNGDRLREVLAGKGKAIVPLFETPHTIKLLPAAERLKQVLGRLGIEAEIRRKPEVTTYWLAYDPTPEQLAENARADKGETIGRIKVTTVNRNDYFATLGGYQVGETVVLLDLATRPDNEMAEHLAKVGVLWPEVSREFPGPGRAIVHCIPQAFHPQRSAIVIQGSDLDGLMAGVEALRRPSDDWLGESVASAREALFREFHVGGEPDQAKGRGLTSRGLTVRHEPKPFTVRFLDKQPLKESEVQPIPPFVHKPLDVPATIECKDFIPQLRTAKGYEDAWTPGGNWKADLRFADAILLVVDVKKPGRTAIAAEGVFRYSDRRPRSQGVWEDILALRDTLVPKERRPMAFDVVLDGQPAGRLDKLTTGTKDVPIDSPPGYGPQKPKTVSEEVVTRIGGELDLPAGTHRLMLVHRNMVDGRLEKVRVGEGP